MTIVPGENGEEPTKRCSKCGRNRPANLTVFPPSKQTKDGLFGWCRECKRGGDMESHNRHRPARTAAMRARYHANPEPQRAASRARAAADPEANRARATAWYREILPQRRAIRRASARRCYAADPERFREVWRARQALIRKGVNGGRIPVELLTAKLDYYGGMCRWCRTRPATDWDHVKPLGKGGPHLLANLTPACERCNSVKRDVWPLSAWLLRLARLIAEDAAA